MRFKKKHRRLLKPIRRQVVEVRLLEKRALGTHLRWTALARYPNMTPLAAVLLLCAEQKEAADG